MDWSGRHCNDWLYSEPALFSRLDHALENGPQRA
jgi:hypothetical protein